ncbi:butyrophilin subfamily 3 member A2-like [Notolabrus celidotus]|uniref:butyrophilin subfamily 3 member A2-like n=1 Tax=Notolabrus celidotus TaxID=1203425 RepID=UPI00148FD7EE|nr:butyrophilin subfamily 3 member A2-like [Notolabrus celidotus]
MFQPKEGRSPKLQLSFSSIVIVIHTAGLLLLTQSSEGQYQVVSPLQPVFTITGDDIFLPCQLEPAIDAVSMAVEWTKMDMYPRFVHVRRGGQDLLEDQNPKYEGRTSLSMNKLKLGDVSLKLSKVKISDAGMYKCLIPGIYRDAFIQLVVGAVSPPVISGIKRSTSGLELQCESKGWYPEPEVLWLDDNGNLLSAGPTETVRGLDDLYSVSSRVTVEKRESNIFTCRVHQRNITQTRETRVKFQDDWVQCSSETPEGRGEEEQLVKGGKSMKGLEDKLQEKEQEKNDMLDLISIMEEQKTELEISKAIHISKLEKVEKERRENEKKLNNVSDTFHWNKDVKKSDLLKLKIELENKKTQYKRSLDSIENKLQKTTHVILKMTDRKEKVENQIDEIKEALNEMKTQQDEDQERLQSEQSESEEESEQHYETVEVTDSYYNN